MTFLRKGRPTRPLIITLICLVLAAAFAVGLQARERAVSPECPCRYTVLDGPPSPLERRAAAEAQCNQPHRVESRQAVCFFDPRHPPSNGAASRSTRG